MAVETLGNDVFSFSRYSGSSIHRRRLREKSKKSMLFFQRDLSSEIGVQFGGSLASLIAGRFGKVYRDEIPTIRVMDSDICFISSSIEHTWKYVHIPHAPESAHTESILNLYGCFWHREQYIHI